MAKAYERIADDLRQEIRDGSLQPGDRLPPEAKLAQNYGKSMPTIQNALRVLQHEGLIEKQHGVGSFVRRPRRRTLLTNTQHQREKDRARAPQEDRADAPADTATRVTHRKVQAAEDVAQALGVPGGTDLMEFTVRSRYTDEKAPLALATSYLVCDMIADSAPPPGSDREAGPGPGGTMALLSAAGIELDRVEERLTARPPSRLEAEELELPPGMPVLCVWMTSYDTDNRPVRLSIITLPGDRAEVHVVTPLKRW